jgi:hypothetical protein
MRIVKSAPIKGSPGIGGQFDITFKLNTRDYNALKRSIINMKTLVPQQTMMGLSELAKKIVKNAKMFAPRFTGALRDSITARKMMNSIIVSADVPYSAMQEYGFKPHYVSTSKHPELLAWMMFKGLPFSLYSQYLLVKKFPRGIGYFMEPAVLKTMGLFDSTLDRHVTAAIKKSFAGMRNATG